MQIDLLDQPVVSQHHYTNMELLIYKLQNRPQSKIHSVLLSSKEIPEMSKRIPYPQLLLEHRKQNLTEGEEHLIYTGEDTLHPLLKSQYLQCSEVAHSAKGHDQNNVLETYCELAILGSLIHGGKSLSLKAYFIYKLPDLMPLHETLSYLNLSFNDFRLFPTEVYMLENLEVLKLRNNPINEIPYGIHNLKKLRTLIMSFCLLSSLPAGLFLLRNLQTLDVSYNSICSIPKDIGNLRLLEFLNVEGNSLPALPCEALKLKLKYLRVANNEMHPLFWRENTCIKPQKLTDLAALSFAKNNMWHHVKKIPNDVKKILDNVNVCDCCTGPLYGQGLFFIRPCEKIFGIRKLPFMFQACSPSCYKNFMCQRESLTEHLYGC
ncbi:leucine-rich repeat-containing protein 63 [Bombina bombina]|uniref:leucine-rich repeat-containing protein 63 n=1 Tax=Bombina bombina TaxID=8345 RepID=UPI00235B28F6|nr:leucine-rich repeat-containing protein 63 [Bombina bombina]